MMQFCELTPPTQCSPQPKALLMAAASMPPASLRGPAERRPNVLRKLTAKKSADPFKKTTPDPNQKIHPTLKPAARFEESKSINEQASRFATFSPPPRAPSARPTLLQTARECDLQEWFEERPRALGQDSRKGPTRGPEAHREGAVHGSASARPRS
jgi:hypothetical protein